MTYVHSNACCEWIDQVPLPFPEWKTLLANVTKEDIIKQFSSNSNPQRRSIPRQYSCPSKKQERIPLSKTQIFTEPIVDSFLVSSATVTQPSINYLVREDVPKIISPPTKQYVSSFTTPVHATSSRQSQRIKCVNDNVIILKLSKENATENIAGSLQVSSKHSILSTTPPLKESSTSYTSNFSPVLKTEGQKQSTIPNDFPLKSITIIEQNSTSSNTTHSMATSTSSHPSSNPSLFAYRNTLTAGTTVRQRALAETTANSLFITTERLKTSISTAMRPSRQSLTATATAVSTPYVPAQPSQRQASQSSKIRVQQDKPTNFKDVYEYPDPFTNCPPELLGKLAQLTKLQLETIEWEKRRRFTKKKPMTNGYTNGKDSP